MCFSATASFAAGTALVAVGVFTVNRAQDRRELPLALVPLLFGVQQITEGALWLALGNELATLQSWATYAFSFFSHAFWPVFVPFAILAVETHRRRQQALRAFLAVGVAVSLYLLFYLFRFPVVASVRESSILYESPHFYLYGVLVLYLLATCISGLFSSHHCINVFGLLAFVLAVAAYQVSAQTFVSVWCFFAAVLSLVIVIHFSGRMRSRRLAGQGTALAYSQRT